MFFSSKSIQSGVSAGLKHLNNNRFIINMVGDSDKDVDQAVKEVVQIAQLQGYTTKITNIQPTLLSNEYTNSMPEWRIKLKQEINSPDPVEIIVNKIIGGANSEEITDLTRSTRAMSCNFVHPWVLIVDPDAKTCHESVFLTDNKNNYLQQRMYSQFNCVYPLAGTFEEKTNNLMGFLG